MKLSQKEIDQVNRIKEKMPKALICDMNFTNFGAKNHKYIWNKPCSEEDLKKFEKENLVEIPRSYRIFLSAISNGGPFFGCGLYSLEDIRIYGNIKKDSIFYPEMTEEEFDKIQNEFNKEDSIDDPNYDGLLIIGTIAYTYDFAIIVSGKYKGRILLTDGNMERPFQFVHDENFLDYYERWIDDLTSGMNMTRFDISYPGDEEELIKKFNETKDELERYYLFMSIIRFKNPSKEAIDLCKDICSSDYGEDIKERALIRLYKFERGLCFKFIDQYLSGSKIEKAIAIKIISATQDKLEIEKYFPRLIDLMEESSNYEFEKNDEVNSFNRICFILSDNKKDFMDLYIPFFKHEDEKIRAAAIWNSGHVINARFFCKEYIVGLKDESERVVLATIQALQTIGIFQKDLLPYLNEAYEKFPEENYHIRESIGTLLKSWGFTKQKKS